MRPRADPTGELARTSHKVSYSPGRAMNKSEVKQGSRLPDLQHSCVVAGCHLRRKVCELAVSHDPHKPNVRHDPGTTVSRVFTRYIRYQISKIRRVLAYNQRRTLAL